MKIPKKKIKLKNTREVILRGVEERDINQIWDIFNEVVLEKKYLPVLSLVIDDWEKKTWYKEFSGTGNFCIVAELLGAPPSQNILGQCTIEDLQWEAAFHVGELGILVKKEYRNLGLGRELIEYAKEVAKMRGKEKIILSTFSTNEAGLHLYRKCGFIECGLHHNQFYMDGKYIDEVLMETFLDGNFS